jgi:hypothetical protein
MDLSGDNLKFDFDKATTYSTTNSDELCKLLRGLDKQLTSKRETDVLKRIRPTENNPSSSRSIIVYTFQITIKGVCTYLQVADMMGYEDFGVIKPVDSVSVEPTMKAPSKMAHIQPTNPTPNSVQQEARKLLLDEGHFIRYSLALAVEHTNVSPELNNALFNFPATNNTTLKNIGIYIVNNTGANRQKTNLLFQSALFGDPSIKKLTRNEKEDRFDVLGARKSIHGPDKSKIAFKISYPSSDSIIQSNSARIQSKLDGLVKPPNTGELFASIAILAVVKNRQIDRYFEMQEQQIKFLDSLNVAPTQEAK